MDVLVISLRWPALSGLPLLVPVAVPGLLVGSAADSLALVVTSVGFLAILRVDALMRLGSCWSDRIMRPTYTPYGYRPRGCES
uniref:hypothetical protein n=1 Tax=Cryobacterium sp. TaxID=1926290 RepID=UPI001C69395D